jgi:hypothetical protein
MKSRTSRDASRNANQFRRSIGRDAGGAASGPNRTFVFSGKWDCFPSIKSPTAIASSSNWSAAE